MFNKLYSPDKRITKMYSYRYILKNKHKDTIYAIIKDCFFAKFLFENNLKVDNVFFRNDIFEYNRTLYAIWKNRFKKITIGDDVNMSSISINYLRSIPSFKIRFQTKKQIYEFKKLCIKDKLKR